MSKTSPLKLIYAGTPEFSARILQSLLNSQHQVVAVYTQPDRPVGRGLQVLPSPVKQVALTAGLPVLQPSTLNTAAAVAELQAWQADVMVVFAYGLMLPEAILHIPRLGCINIHPSLLPRWRGSSPIQYAILNGDSVTGVSIMQISLQLDAGPILRQVQCVIAPEDTAATLAEKLLQLSAEVLSEVLQDMQQNIHRAVPQDDNVATYTHKLDKQAALLDWHKPAAILAQQVRAFNPKPVTYSFLQSQNIRIWNASALVDTTTATPGTILHVTRAGIDVATGAGVLRITQLQLPGKRMLNVAEIINAQNSLFVVGAQFTNVAHE